MMYMMQSRQTLIYGIVGDLYEENEVLPSDVDFTRLGMYAFPSLNASDHARRRTRPDRVTTIDRCASTNYPAIRLCRYSTRLDLDRSTRLNST